MGAVGVVYDMGQAEMAVNNIFTTPGQGLFTKRWSPFHCIYALSNDSGARKHISKPTSAGMKES
jgi:hypothetical protein